MMNDLLPDEIYIRHADGYVKEADVYEVLTFATEEDNVTSYIRADLVRTSNKPAEVDLAAAIQLVRSGFIVRENIGDLQFDKYAKALELIISLATGKGGGDLEHQLFCLKSDYKRLETHSRNQAEEHDATKRELAQAKLELARIRKAQPTAPVQIDTGELEKAIQYVEGWADSMSKKASPFEAEDLAAFFDVCAAARAQCRSS